MNALVVFCALLVAATSQNTDNTESSTTENNLTTENVPRPDCKCALRPGGNSPFPFPSPAVYPSQPYPYPQPPSYPNVPLPYTNNQYPPIQPQSFNRYPSLPFPPFPARSPGRRSPRAAPHPYSSEWQPAQPYPSPRDPRPSRGDPVQSYVSRGSNNQPDYQISQGPQQSALGYRGDTHPYWDDSDSSPIQQSPVQQVYYVPDGYYEYDTPVRQMPVQQVLVMQRH